MDRDEREAALRRRAACEDVLREAEDAGNYHLAQQASRLLAAAEAVVDEIVEEERRENAAALEDFGLDPGLLERRLESGSEKLERFLRTGDTSALAEALDSGDPAVAEQIREAAA